MSLLALMLGWLLARTIRIVPAGREETSASPVPGTPSVPTTPTGVQRTPRTARRPTAPPATTRPATTTAPASMPAANSPPWPQLMPSGLPPFPLGWTPYDPPPPAVVQRANALLPQLWQGGPGTFKVEKTAGVWVYYRATPMGEKKGVVAFREKAASSATAETERDAARIQPVVVTPMGPASPAPATSQASVPPQTAVVLPTLRRGSSGPDVVILQKRLGIPADGKFGPQTEAAVRTYQGRNGLVADGIVGPKTWASLMGSRA